ncbi:hypothetical protein T492DRAFT_1067382 [Pavlovales sp. CCMP2436]|nr:hypothetical protein T492DRAFT_1067382 [Pavlovales sp. CCMP2436]
MGCSSGAPAFAGEFELPTMHGSYLLGGSPAVIATLWDVTDGDIDRFCAALLERCSTHDGVSLPCALAHARSACKMAHLVGAAPVCYGIPARFYEAAQC